MTADDVAAVVAAACKGHHRVRDTRRRQSIYRDRVALDVTTTDGNTWRVHVLTDAVRGGGSR
jgi:hypothetical protein